MKRLLPLLCVMLVSACGGRPAPDLYVLRVPEATQLTACHAKKETLIIERPVSPQEYDSKRIAVLLDANHLNYYTGASWASPLPDQLRDFMIDVFTRSGQFASATGAADQHAGYRVQMTLLEADVTNPDAPVITLRMVGAVRSNTTGTVVKRFHVDETVPASQNHMADIVDAYSRAASNAAQTIAQSLCKH